MNRRSWRLLLGGTAFNWPFAVSAQQKAMPVIGYLSAGSPGPAARFLACPPQLGETGCLDGQNVMIQCRLGGGSVMIGCPH